MLISACVFFVEKKYNLKDTMSSVEACINLPWHLYVYYKSISNFCLVNNVFLVLRVILNGENNQRMGDTFIVAKYRDVIFTRMLHARKLLMPFTDLELQIRLKLRSVRVHIERRGEYPSKIFLFGTSYLSIGFIF